MNNNKTFDSNNRLIESDKQYEFEDMYTKLSKQKERIDTIRNNYAIDFLNNHIYPLLIEFSNNSLDLNLKINIEEILPNYTVYKKQITDNLQTESFEVHWKEEFLKISWDLNKKCIDENSIYFKVLKNQEILDRNYKKSILIELKDYVANVLYKQMEDSIGYSDFVLTDLPKKFRNDFCKSQLIELLKNSNIYAEYINSFKLKLHLNDSYTNISGMLAKEKKQQVDIKTKEILSSLKQKDKYLVLNNFDKATLISAFLLIILISNNIFLSVFTKKDCLIIKNILFLIILKGFLLIIAFFIKNIYLKSRLKRSILLEKDFIITNKTIFELEFWKVISYFCSILVMILSLNFYNSKRVSLFYIVVFVVLCILEIGIYAFNISSEYV